MAAAASSKARVIASSFLTQILAGKAAASPPAVSASFAIRRGVHVSSYDKNVEEQVRPAVVPDDVINSAASSDKYWGPHPKTGVFGPLDAKAPGGPDGGADGGTTVLDQKVWFRPLEDVEKPPPVA